MLECGSARRNTAIFSTDRILVTSNEIAKPMSEFAD
jgi:hypothetical protein